MKTIQAPTHILFAAKHSLAYLYVRKQPLNWSQTLYGYYNGCAAILSMVGPLLILPLLRAKLRMRDTNIIVLAFTSTTMSMVWFAFSTQTWMVFMGKYNMTFDLHLVAYLIIPVLAVALDLAKLIN